MPDLAAAGETIALTTVFLHDYTEGATKATYIALLSTLPTDDQGNGLVEVSGNGYARQSVDWGDVVNSKIENQDTVVFQNTGTGWGTIEGFAVYADPTSTALINFLAFKAFTGGDIVNGDGQAVEFRPADLVVTMD